MIQYGVITRVAEPPKDGNMASAIDLYVTLPSKEHEVGLAVEVLGWEAALVFRQPVFGIGELLVLDEGGREVAYPGRKPGKWDVDCEIFDDVHVAIDRAKEVFEASLRVQAAADPS